MVNKSLISKKIVESLSLFVLIVLLLIMLLPFGLVTINSFKTETEYYANGPFRLPKSLNLDTLKKVWDMMDFPIKLRNSIAISLSTALLAIIISLFTAFPLGIGKVKGKYFFIVFFLMANVLPQESLVYPLYYFFKLVGLYDTQFSLILTLATLYSSFGTYFLSSVFSAFTKEIIEAAEIDGCNKLQLLFRIVLPLSMPSLSVLFVFFFIWSWNEFFLPLIFLISNNNQTIPIAMALARGEYGATVTSQAAASLLGVIPCIIFFALFQRTLTKGITLGSIK
jgi:raffinose/stachyose/melibiose transport system permease protein